MEKLSNQERHKHPQAAYALGRTACRRILDQTPYESLNKYLETYNVETARNNGDKIIESNSMDLYRVPNSKSMNIMTSGLDGNTALSLIAIDKKGTRHVYMQNYGKSNEGLTKSIDELKRALYEGLPENSTIERAVLLTPSESDEKGNAIESPENKLLTKYLSETFDTAMEEKGQANENSVFMQTLTYKEKRYVGEDATTLKIECLSDGLTNVVVGDEVISI